MATDRMHANSERNKKNSKWRTKYTKKYSVLVISFLAIDLRAGQKNEATPVIRAEIIMFYR